MAVEDGIDGKVVVDDPCDVGGSDETANDSPVSHRRVIYFLKL